MSNKFNLSANKKLFSLALIALAIPLTIGLVMVSQELRSRAGGGEIIAKVEVSPGAVVTDDIDTHFPVGLSALAYDSTGNPIYSGISYEWSMSSTNSVGTLTKAQREVTEFKPYTYGCGQITVIAKSGSGTQGITKSINVSVGNANGYPDCDSQNPSPTPTIDPRAPHKKAKLIILKNMKVCNISSSCLSLKLTDQQINKLKNEFNDFKNFVNPALNGKIIIDAEVIVIDTQTEINMSPNGYGSGGMWASPTDTKAAIEKYVTRDTDFVFLSHSVFDSEKQEEIPFQFCDLTDSAGWGGIQTGYTWLPQTDPPKWFDCAEKKTIIHGFLHQVDWDLDHLNGLEDIYNNSYAKSMCGNTNSADKYKWFPDPDQADKIPDFPACKDHYNNWSGYCDSIRPEDCDYKFDEHLLKNHFPDNLDFTGNHCRDGKQDFGETSIDSGGPCDTSSPAVIQFNSIKLHGIGNGGDNRNTTSPGNLNPQRKERILTVEVTDAAGNTYVPESGNIFYNTTSGDFSGNITLNVNTIYDGNFIVKIKSPQYLKKQIPGIINFSNNGLIQIPSITLITGDIDNNNVINIKDYDILIDCYSDLLPAKNCSDANKKSSADISDDGKVDASDYNLFLRELSVVNGN